MICVHGWLTNDETFTALQLFGDVDLVARRVLHGKGGGQRQDALGTIDERQT
jgi:hypothetical protein